MSGEGRRLRIVVVDDHHLFRAGVHAELSAHHDVVGEAATPADAIDVIAGSEPDVVLLDVHLPDGGRQVNVTPEMDAAEAEARIRAAISRHFTEVLNRPELLNLLGDNIVVFDHIRPAVGERIFDHLLARILTRVEREHGVAVEVTILGDRALDAPARALAAAAREALRNAARHASGSPVYVFAQASADAAEVFVRDEGPGFELGSVPTERRGVRDAIVGRMASVGGRATVDSRPGEGTEIALRIGPAERAS